MIHKASHNVNAESTCLSLLRQLENIRLVVFLRLKGLSFIPYADRTPIRINDHIYIKFARFIPVVRVLDDIGTRLVHSHLELLDRSGVKASLKGMLFDKRSYRLQISRGTGYCKAIC